MKKTGDKTIPHRKPGPQEARQVSALTRRVEERTAELEILDDLRISLENLHARVGSGFGGEASGRVDRVENRQSVFHTGIEIVGTMTGRRMHDARSGLEIHIIGENDDRVAIHEGMAYGKIVEPGAERATDLGGLRKAFSEGSFRKCFRDDDAFVALTSHASTERN